MSSIGLKYPVAATLNESGGSVAYTEGFSVGKAISASMSVEFSEAILYADNAIAERVKEFKSGTLSLNTDDLAHGVQARLLGRTLSTDSNMSILTAKADDVAPYVGFGFYGIVLRNNVRLYRAIWFYKCQFSAPNIELSTKGESIEFKTPTIEGIVMAVSDNRYMDDAIFTTEADAVGWLDEKGNIVPEIGG